MYVHICIYIHMYMYTNIIAIIGKRSCELEKGQRWLQAGVGERKGREK